MSTNQTDVMPSPFDGPNEQAINPDRVGIFLDKLERIIACLNHNRDLQAMFGTPVSRSLVVVADNNDLRIEEGGRARLDPDQQRTFLRILDAAIQGKDASTV